MLYIIWNHRIFRLRQDGLMESTTAFFDMKSAKWEVQAPEELAMTGADYEFIRDNLDRMRVILPGKDYRPPSVMPRQARVEKSGADTP